MSLVIAWTGKKEESGTEQKHNTRASETQPKFQTIVKQMALQSAVAHCSTAGKQFWVQNAFFAAHVVWLERILPRVNTKQNRCLGYMPGC